MPQEWLWKTNWSSKYHAMETMPWQVCQGSFKESKCLGCSSHHYPTALLHAAATNLNCAAPTLESENESTFIGLYSSAVQTLGCNTCFWWTLLKKY